MTPNDVLLAALATGDSHAYTPVQIQKMLFLIDRNVATQIGGPFYNFQPYDYGPFDAAVYSGVRELTFQQFITTIPTSNGWNSHVLTEEGLHQGKSLLNSLPPEISDYISRVGDFVRNTSFSQLVSAIYNAYPEMKVNSVFRKI